MKNREDVSMGIKKWRQWHIMLTLLAKEMSSVSQIGKNTNFSLQHLPKCKCLEKISIFLKHTCSLKENVENLEDNLVSTANTHSEQKLINIHSKACLNTYNLTMSVKTHSLINLRIREQGVIILSPRDISLHSKMYNVDDNGRDAIQPSLFNTYRDMVNTQQLSIYNKMSLTLSKSSNSIITRIFMVDWEDIQEMKLGIQLKETQTLWNIRDPNLQSEDSKSNKCRNTFDQMSGFSR